MATGESQQGRQVKRRFFSAIYEQNGKIKSYMLNGRKFTGVRIVDRDMRHVIPHKHTKKLSLKFQENESNFKKFFACGAYRQALSIFK